MKTQSLRVSIIVPCRNERHSIGKLMEAILAQDMSGMDWEVIIADGMSDDGTREQIEQYQERSERIRMIDNPQRIVSTGLNSAIQQCRGDVILRMDAHTDYARDYVWRCVRVLLSTGAGNVGGPARVRAAGFWGRAIAAAYQSPFACGGAKFHDPTFKGYVNTVPYGCWKRSTLETLGGFDPALVRNQDDELNFRLRRAGWTIWQSPDIVSWYTPRARLRSLFRQYFQYGFWKVAVIRKNGRPAALRHLVPVLWVLANIVLLLGIGISALLELKLFLALAGVGWMLMTLAYFAASVFAAVQAAQKHGWSLMLVLPLVFAVYHFSYGLGFLLGLIYTLPAGESETPAPGKVFTEISR